MSAAGMVRGQNTVRRHLRRKVRDQRSDAPAQVDKSSVTPSPMAASASITSFDGSRASSAISASLASPPPRLPIAIAAARRTEADGSIRPPRSSRSGTPAFSASANAGSREHSVVRISFRTAQWPATRSRDGLAWRSTRVVRPRGSGSPMIPPPDGYPPCSYANRRSPDSARQRVSAPPVP